MAIAFRKFTASANMSEETTCYDTQVLFNGKLLGTCRNDGRGGMGHFRLDEKATAQEMEAAQAWATAQPYVDPDGQVALKDGKPWLHAYLEDYCDTLAAQLLDKRETTRQLRAALKKRTLFLDPVQGPGIYQVNQAWEPRMEEALRRRHPQATVLNALPLEAAVEAYQAEEGRLWRAQQQASPPPAATAGHGAGPRVR